MAAGTGVGGEAGAPVGAGTGGRASPGPRRVLALVGLAYLALSLGYSLATPAGEGPDEPGHIAYVQWLLDHGRPPRHGEAGEPLAQQVKHPPLYYALGALATAWADYGELRFIPNPQFSANLADAPVPTAHAHSADELWPWAERYLAVRALRLLSLLLGLLVVLATYALARTALPAAPWLAPAAAALVAFLPQFLFMSGVVNNDALANAAAAWALVAATRVLTRGARRADLLALGLALALGLLAKLTTLALVAVAGLALAMAAWRARSWRVLVRGAAWAGLPLLLVAGWWFAGNLALVGDPLGWSGFETAAAASRRTRPLSEDLALYWRLQLESFLGRFGWMILALPAWLYTLFRCLLLLAAAGLGALVLRALRRPEDPGNPLASRDGRWAVALLALAVALVAASVFSLAFGFDLVVAQGRYLFPGLAAFGVLVALGLLGWLPPRLAPAGALTLAGAWLALGIYGLVAVLAPAYALPEPVPAAELAALGPQPEVRFGDWVSLVGWRLGPERPRPGEVLTATLYWRSDSAPPESLKMFAQLDGAADSGLNRLPGAGRYPVGSWLPGRVWRESVSLPVPAKLAAESPRAVDLLVGWYPESRPAEPLPARVAGRPLEGPLRLGPLVLLPAATPAPLPVGGAGAVDAVWSTGPGAPPWVRLEALEVETAAEGAGEGGRPSGAAVLAVRPRWRALGEVGNDLTVFVHLVGPDGRPLATADGEPEGLRTSLWRAGDLLLDRHPLAAPAAHGEYRLLLGLYDRATGRRLPASRADGRRWPEDAVAAGTLSVGPSGVRWAPPPAGEVPAP